MANQESWLDAIRNYRINQEAEILSYTPVNTPNRDKILADVAHLKEDPNALHPDKTTQLLAHMKINNMTDEFDDLVETLRPSRKARFKAGSQGFLDNWLALGLVDDKTYATNPHTERDKAIGQVLGSAALFGLGHPLTWLMGRSGIGMKLAKANKAAKATDKATKGAKVVKAATTSSAIAKAATAIGRVTDVASGVSSVGKSIKPVVGLATGKYDYPWNEIKLRDTINEIADPFVYPGQFINK